MATSPQFAATPKISSADTGTTANTNLNGSGTITHLLTVGASGGRVDTVYCRPTGSTSTASALRFFVSPTGSTSNFKLVHEETLPINTLTQVAATTPIVWRANIIMPAGSTMGITIGNALGAAWQVTAEHGDF